MHQASGAEVPGSNPALQKNLRVDRETYPRGKDL